MTAATALEEIMEIEATMGKGAKKPRDLNAPKRPVMSAFVIWAGTVRPKLKAANPEWTMGRVATELGYTWNGLSSSKKKPFLDQAGKASRNYLKKMDKYSKTHEAKQFQKVMLAWRIKQTKTPYGPDPNAPKRPYSAYQLYAKAIRGQVIEENPDSLASEIMTIQAIWWKALNNEDREPWDEQAAVEKKKYERALAKYRKTDEYLMYVTEREGYKERMISRRNKLMGIKKKKRSRAKDQPSRSAKRARRAKTPTHRRMRSRSASRRRRSVRRARTPKAPKRGLKRKTSHRRRRSFARKAGARRRAASTSKSVKRRPRTSRSASRAASVTSRSRSTSRSARKPKASKRKHYSTSRSSKRKAARRTKKRRRSSRSSVSRASSRRSSVKVKRRRSSRSSSATVKRRSSTRLPASGASSPPSSAEKTKAKVWKEPKIIPSGPKADEIAKLLKIKDELPRNEKELDIYMRFKAAKEANNWKRGPGSKYEGKPADMWTPRKSKLHKLLKEEKKRLAFEAKKKRLEDLRMGLLSKSKENRSKEALTEQKTRRRKKNTRRVTRRAKRRARRAARRAKTPKSPKRRSKSRRHKRRASSRRRSSNAAQRRSKKRTRRTRRSARRSTVRPTKRHRVARKKRETARANSEDLKSQTKSDTEESNPRPATSVLYGIC